MSTPSIICLAILVGLAAVGLLFFLWLLIVPTGIAVAVMGW